MLKRSIVILVLGMAIFLLAACSPSPVVQQAAETLAVPTTAVVTPTPTTEPSPTPAPGKVLLVAPAGTDSAEAQTLLASLSESAGMGFETAAALEPGQVVEGTRVVILFSPPANLADLVASAPQTQFVVVSPVDVPPAANLSVIRLLPENQAFVAGYISVLLSTDWRSGGLLPSDTPLAEQIKDAYINGGRYHCGICAPGWPQQVLYPQVAQVPAAADGATYQAAAADLYETYKVEAYYLPAAAARPEVYQFVQGKDQFGKLVLLVGEQAPPEELSDQWAATVRFDTTSSLESIWPNLIAGQGGSAVNAPLVLDDVNPDNLAAGRLRLVEDVMADLEAGKISPFTVPAE